MSSRLVRRPVALALLLAACSGGSVLAPQFQPQVANNPDNFQFQATGVTNVTQVLTYRWSCSSGTASVNPATTTTSGSVSMVIKDGAGATVYSGNVPPSGTFNTSPAGSVGMWTIELTFTDYSGTINFRVQKF